MTTENERRVTEFAAGGKGLIDEWTATMAGFAQRLDNDSLTVDDIVKYWSASTKLAFKGWGLAFSMLGDPVAKSAPAPDQAGDKAASGFFPVQLNPAVAGTLLLEPAGPLRSDVGGHQVPTNAIELKPKELGANERQLRVQFTKGTLPKLIYRGKVDVRAAAGGPILKTIDVSVEVK